MEKEFIEWEKKNRKPFRVDRKKWTLFQMEKAEYDCYAFAPLININSTPTIINKSDMAETTYSKIFNRRDSEPGYAHIPMSEHKKIILQAEYAVKERERERRKKHAEKVKILEMEREFKESKEKTLIKIFITLKINNDSIYKYFNQTEIEYIHKIMYMIKEKKTTLNKRSDQIWQAIMYDLITTEIGREKIEKTYIEMIKDFQ